MSNKDKRIKECPEPGCTRHIEHYKYKPSDRFCALCGSQLVFVCAKCFKEIEDTEDQYRYCEECKPRKPKDGASTQKPPKDKKNKEKKAVKAQKPPREKKEKKSLVRVKKPSPKALLS